MAWASPDRGAYAQTPLHTLHGRADGSRFGAAMAELGDVNGDGHDDFIVAAPDYFLSGVAIGCVSIISGADGQALSTLYGHPRGGGFGRSVAGLGDLDGDGRPEFVVGSPSEQTNGQRTGTVRVFSGADRALLYLVPGSSADHFFGGAVSGIGDLDGDGVEDVVVGAPANGSSLGRALVISGADGSQIHVLHGFAARDWFGSSVSGLGDVDGDGMAEILVGAPGSDTNGLESGSAYVFSGRDGTLLYSLNGELESAGFGASLNGIGDADGDGRADFVVGAPRDDSGFRESGSARVFSGVDGTEIYTLHGDRSEDYFGSSVAGLGDVDGDGLGDLVVGALEVTFFPVSTLEGRAQVFSGVDGAVLISYRGSATDRLMGAVVSGAGDVDGDGRPDLLIGSQRANVNGVSVGSVHVVAYSPAGSSMVGLNFCTPAVNSTGRGAHLSATGSDRVADNDLTLHGEYLPSRAFGLFLNARRHGHVPAVNGSVGTLCLASLDIGRFTGPGQIQSTQGGSTVALSIDLIRLPGPVGSVRVAPGETWYFQLWYRDTGSRTNFTDALRVEFR